MSILARLLSLGMMIIVTVITIVFFLVADWHAALWVFFTGPIDSIRHIGNIIELAIPLMMTGLAAALMFRCGLLNIGVEGAFFLGALVTVAIIVKAPISGLTSMVIALAAAALVGSLVCVIAAVMRVAYAIPELLSSLMLNYIALYVGLFMFSTYLFDSTAFFMATPRIPNDAKFIILINGTRVHFGLIIAVVCCILAGIYMFTTKIGLHWRILGANVGFAQHLGIQITPLLLSVQFIGGALAALGGGIEMLGLYDRFTWQALSGHGWMGIAVAILARNNPFFIVPAALFLSYIEVGGDLLSHSHDVPSEWVGLIQALVILVMSAETIFIRLYLWLPRTIIKEKAATDV